MKRIIPVILLLAAVPLMSCHRVHPGFTEGEGGMYYKFHQQNKEGEKIIPGDEVVVSMKLYTPDTIFLSTVKDNLLTDHIVLEQPVYPGDLYTALLMMHAGDSATFVLKGRELFLTFFRMPELPHFITDTSGVFLDVRIRERIPKAESEKRRKSLAEARTKMLEEFKRNEPEKIATFLKEKGFRNKPTKSGLYYIETRAGKGKNVQPGNSVTVQYVARLTDGKIIETSLKEEAIKNGIFDSLFEYTPFTFVMGDKSTVAGWEEGISYMRTGGKAILVVPSSLAYGEMGLEELIPPYSPVVYEIEVLEIK